MSERRSVAVIGANSYIARNMIRTGKKRDDIDLTLYGYEPAHLDGEGPYHQVDTLSKEDMEKAVEGHDLIYFFVGKVGTLDGFERPDDYLDINERMLFVLLNACKEKNGSAKIVFPSTRLVYHGSSEELAEDAEKEFLTPYAMQKYACEQYLEMYRRLYGIHYVVLRICVPYGTLVGPSNSYGTLGFFEKQAKEKRAVSVYGTGEQRRTFTYIEDLCRMLWGAGLSELCVDDVYNVGGETLSIRQAAEKVAALHGARVEETPWPELALRIESGDTVFDGRKLEMALGIRPEMEIDRWLKETVR